YGTSKSGPTFSYSANDNGTYVVTLKATDDDSGVGTTTATTIVGNVAPRVIINTANNDPNGGTVNTGFEINLSSLVIDPGANEQHVYSWSVTVNGVPLTGANISDPTQSKFSFNRAGAGTYLVTLTVTDKDGGSDTDIAQMIFGTAGPDTINLVN